MTSHRNSATITSKHANHEVRRVRFPGVDTDTRWLVEAFHNCPSKLP